MENQEIKNEIRKEFQLDRMILFSDAVFAIVITLMAIEIRLPENNINPLSYQLLHLLPVIFAYIASFIFIGHIWYQHLLVFGLLKSFDKGLIIRNLLMLFWIGLVPFSVSLISLHSNKFLAIIIYLVIIFLCKGSQLMLQNYILIQQPRIRVKNGIHDELVRYKKTRIAVITLGIFSILVISTMLLMKDTGYSNFAWFWFFIFPFVLKYFQRKVK